MGSYRALETLYREGKVRHIGISNYTVKHLEHLLEHCEIIPHVHQFELHPRLVQQDILNLCDKHEIQIQAYSSLGEGKLLTDEAVLDIVKKEKGDTAQILLRWAIQHGWIVIPKSSSSDRVSSNANVLSLELSEEVKLFFSSSITLADAKTFFLFIIESFTSFEFSMVN